jgi:hypothetical protein
MQTTLPVEKAVGTVLPHDITEIVQGTFKGPAFKKGHIIRPEDIEHLKRLGKDHIYVIKLEPHELHEDEVALILATSLIGQGAGFSPKPVEGKISIVADQNGLLKINRESLLDFNMLGDVMCSTLQTNTLVKKGEIIAGTRLIPLFCERSIVDEAVKIAKSRGPVIQVIPLCQVKVGLVITGNEVFYGRIQDKFEPVLRQKLQNLGSTIAQVRFAPDDPALIAAAINECLADGVGLIVTSGGMSIDPDDMTREGIRQAGATDIVYGTPVLPGAMFLSGRIGQVPILGLPACGMFHKITVFDLILPRILIGEIIGRHDLAELGHGGLCRNCKDCHYPVCSFGK